MEIKQQTRLNFLGIDILSLQFQSEAPHNAEEEIKLTINPKVHYPEGDPDSFSIVMSVLAECQMSFTLNVVAVGRFTLDSDAEEGMRKAFVNLNAPAIMFPYVRSFISTMTANMGKSVSTLTIPPHFFKGQLEEIQDDSHE